MHWRRIASFLLGAWLAGSLVAALACLNNVNSVDEALASGDTTARQVIARAEHEGARMLLSSLTAVQNARLLSNWELAEAPIGLLLMFTLLMERHTRILAALPLVMLLLVGFEHVLVLPDIAWLSQALSFLPVGEGGAQRGRLDNLDRIYFFAEALKLLFGLGLAVLLFVMRAERRGSRSSSHMSNPLERRARV